MTTSDLITLAIAVAGLLLGIRSAWRDFARDRLRLRVLPKVGYPVGTVPDPRPRFAFEITNLGTFPVSANEVGFLYRDGPHRGTLVAPETSDKGPWPRRIEPHDSLTLYSAPIDTLGVNLQAIRCAYVSSASGRVFRGTSKALKTVAAWGEIPPPPVNISRRGLTAMFTVSDFADAPSSQPANDGMEPTAPG